MGVLTESSAVISLVFFAAYSLALCIILIFSHLDPILFLFLATEYTLVLVATAALWSTWMIPVVLLVLLLIWSLIPPHLSIHTTLSWTLLAFYFFNVSLALGDSAWGCVGLVLPAVLLRLNVLIQPIPSAKSA